MSKVVLITGAARRVGAAIAAVFHTANYRVIVHYRHSKTEAETLVSSFNTMRNDSAYAIQADLDDETSYTALVMQSAAHFGQLDVLINNASTFYKTPIGSIAKKDWDALLHSNLMAPLFLSQAAFPILKKTNGNIINIIDIQKPLKQYSVYSAAKAGLLMLTKSLALECGPDVRVNAIGPGHVIWPENETAFSPIEKEKILAETFLGRNVSPTDIGETALFLANQSSITGQMICVDGGRL